MAKFRSVRKQRPPKRFHIPGQLVQWGVVGVVTLAIIALVTRALTRAPVEPGPAPVLAQARTDLAVVTRLLGDVVLDSSVRHRFPASLAPRLLGPDTLVEARRWFDATALLDRQMRKASGSEVPALRGYIGYCYYAAASPDRALREFRRGLAAAETTGSELTSWLAASAGYLFQSRGFADSSVGYYLKAESALGLARARTPRPETDSARVSWLEAELANNLGVAYEALKDSSAAAEQYQKALGLLDSTADPRSARVVRDNLNRLPSRP